MHQNVNCRGFAPDHCGVYSAPQREPLYGRKRIRKRERERKRRRGNEM